MAVTINTPQSLTVAYASNPIIAYIDSTHFVAAWKAVSTLYAVIGTISGTTISFGSIYTSGVSSGDNYHQIILLDTTHFVIVWESGTYYYLQGLVGTISGTTISFGGIQTIDNSTGGLYPLFISTMSSSNFICAYGAGGGGKIVVCTVSGSTISKGSYVSTPYFPESVVCLSSILMVVEGSNQQVIAGTISGTTITLGSPVTISGPAYGNGAASLAAINSTTFIAGGIDYYNYNVCAVIGTISGTTITLGSVTTGPSVPSNAGTPCSIILSSTSYLFTSADNGGQVYAIPATISGTTISFGSKASYSSTPVNSFQSTPLTSSSAVGGWYLDSTHLDFSVITGSTAYTLTAAYASFGQSGYTSTKGLGFPLAYAAFALSGIVSTFKKAWKAVAAYGSYTLSGFVTTLSHIWKAFQVATGHFTLTGFAATMAKIHAYILTAANSVFTLTGESAVINSIRRILASVGNYTLTGFATVLHHMEAMIAACGMYAQTGFSIIANKVWKPLTAAYSTFTLTGKNSAFAKMWKAIMSTGYFALSGFNTVLSHVWKALTAASATFTLTGEAVTWLKGHILTAVTGMFNLLGFNFKESPTYWQRRIKPALTSWAARTKPTTNWVKRIKP